MKMRLMGNTGIKVSEICFGAMTFGGRGYWKNIGELEQKEVDELVNLAIERGIKRYRTRHKS